MTDHVGHSPSVQAGQAAPWGGGGYRGGLGFGVVAHLLLVAQTQLAVMALVVPAVLPLVIAQPGLVVFPIVVTET